jgi:hypothetical protein
VLAMLMLAVLCGSWSWCCLCVLNKQNV